jgi:hypothetical protein
VAHASAWPISEDRYAWHGPGLRAFLRAMYDETQADLAGRGVERLLLWRGGAVDIEAAPSARAALDLQPLSSFTTRFEIASRYATS